MSYVELHAKSAFSFLEGASVPEELISACAELQMPAMALLDRDGVYGAPRFHLAAKKNGIKAHIGAEISVKVQSPKSKVQSQRDIGHWTLDIGQKLSPSYHPVVRIPVLVRNRTGYQNLCRLITLMKLRVPKHAKPGQCAVAMDELAAHARGLICLTGGEQGPLGLKDEETVRSGDWGKTVRIGEWLLDVFGKGNVYAELQRHFNRQEEARNQAVVQLAKRLKLPLLATNGIYHATPAQREVADVFTCLRNHVRLENAGQLLATNSERYLKSAQTMMNLFADLPEAIANSR